MISYIIVGGLALVILACFSPVLFKKLRVKGFVAINAVESLLDNPVEESKFDLAVAKKELNKNRISLAELIGANNTLVNEKHSLEEESAKFDRLATKAGIAGNENDVRTFVNSKNRSDKRLAQISKDSVTNQVVIDKLKEAIQQHENRIFDAESKSVELSGRFQNAKLREKLVHTEFSDIGLKGLEGFEKKVQQLEANVEGKVEVFSSSVESKYDVQDNEEEVAKYMKK